MYTINNSFVNTIKEAMENDQINYLSNLNDNEFCGFCLIKKPHKTRHCPNTNLCVPKFHFYSRIFDKPVYFRNQMSYFIMFTLQIFLIYRLLSMFSDYEIDAISAEKIWITPPYILFQWTRVKGYWVGAFMYLIVFYIFAYNFWFYSLFVYGICRNYTMDELFNPQHYPYLTKVKNPFDVETIEKVDPEADANPNMIRYVNPNDNGIQANIKLFISQSMHSRFLIR